MKSILLLMCLFLIPACSKENQSVGNNKKKQRILAVFDHNYNGIIPRKSSFDKAIKILGEPLKKELVSQGKNYFFDKVIINIKDAKQNEVHTISIIKDYDYSCPNGIKLNENLLVAKSKLHKYKDLGKCVFDVDKGIIYWNDGQNVKKIVLAGKAMIPDDWLKNETITTSNKE